MMHMRVPRERHEDVDVEQWDERSVLVEGSANHLGRDRWGSRGYANGWQVARGVDLGRRQPATGQL